MNTKKIAIVTGGCSGIGLATVRRLISGAIFFPVILDINDPIENLAESMFIKTDVTKEDAVQRAIDNVMRRFSRVDGLVNAAGRGGGGHTHQLSLSEFESNLAINLTGTFLTAKHCLKVMVEQRSGSIVNISSVVALQSLTGATQYTASKAAVLGLTRTIAVDYALLGIRANAICPGYVETEGVSHLKSPELKWVEDEIISCSPSKRSGKPDEVAAVVEFLLSDNSSIITGATIPCDLGWSAGRHIGNYLL